MNTRCHVLDTDASYALNRKRTDEILFMLQPPLLKVRRPVSCVLVMLGRVMFGMTSRRSFAFILKLLTSHPPPRGDQIKIVRLILSTLQHREEM